jgi:hypothetical protein
MRQENFEFLHISPPDDEADCEACSLSASKAEDRPEQSIKPEFAELDVDAEIQVLLRMHLKSRSHVKCSAGPTSNIDQRDNIKYTSNKMALPPPAKYSRPGEKRN